MIRVVGRAKINLWLEVVGRRQDGYHELETVMQSIDLWDELEFGTGEHSEVNLRWAPGISGSLPEPPDIVHRTVVAARLQSPARPVVTVEKRIPVGAGLGGASADAAAALLGLASLEEQAGITEPMPLGLLAAQLGADVPFCLQGGTALATGIGDRLRPLRCPVPLWWVIGISEVELSTVDVYRRFDELVPSGGRAAIGGQPARSTTALVAALEGGDLDAVATNMSNDLELAAFDLVPELAELKERMAQCGPLTAMMTGSGSAIVGLCRDAGHAGEVAERAREVFSRVEIAPSAPAGAEVREHTAG